MEIVGVVIVSIRGMALEVVVGIRVEEECL